MCYRSHIENDFRNLISRRNRNFLDPAKGALALTRLMTIVSLRLTTDF